MNPLMTSIDVLYITVPTYQLVESGIHIIGGAVVAGGGALFGIWVFIRVLSEILSRQMDQNGKPVERDDL